jgi:hypothetical protein
MKNQILKNKIAARETTQLILDATIARLNKACEAARLVFALIIEELILRLPNNEFEAIYETLTND